MHRIIPFPCFWGRDQCSYSAWWWLGLDASLGTWVSSTVTQFQGFSTHLWTWYSWRAHHALKKNKIENETVKTQALKAPVFPSLSLSFKTTGCTHQGEARGKVQGETLKTLSPPRGLQQRCHCRKATHLLSFFPLRASSARNASSSHPLQGKHSIVLRRPEPPDCKARYILHCNLLPSSGPNHPAKEEGRNLLCSHLTKINAQPVQGANNDWEERIENEGLWIFSVTIWSRMGDLEEQPHPGDRKHLGLGRKNHPWQQELQRSSTGWKQEDWEEYKGLDGGGASTPPCMNLNIYEQGVEGNGGKSPHASTICSYSTPILLCLSYSQLPLGMMDPASIWYE